MDSVKSDSNQHGAEPLPIIGVDRRSAVPLYRQVYEAYREAIVERRLDPGQRLPSSRALALDLGISRLPVLTAFEQLLAEGYCESRTGAGTFVATSLQLRRTAPPPEPPGLEGPAVEAPRRIAAAPPRRSLPVPSWLWLGGPASIGRVAVEHFPHALWARILARHTRAATPAVTGYGEVMGYRPLREALAGYLRAARAVRATADQILVTSGSQQALDLATRVLLEPGDAAWIEDPGYWGVQRVFEARGVRAIPVPVDEEGLDVEAGIRRSRELGLEPRAAFVTPSHQFPLGATMSASRRLQLLDWARTRGSWIIEDDYNSEYRYESQPVSSLQGMDRAARVLYVGTFSKVLFPALRTGYIVLPPDLVPHFFGERRNLDLSPPGLLQAALTDLIVEGHFARHLRKTREIYRARRGVLIEHLEATFGDSIDILGEQAGLHLTVTLEGDPPDVPIAERAAEAGLRTLPLSTLCLEAPLRGLVLGYGDTSIDEIPRVVLTLRAVIDAAGSRSFGRSKG
jgi:GntR family transcriptional regulator/MocR family aminotransferase